MPASAPRSLVVVGAALGIGRWLGEHLLPHSEWDRVLLVDHREVRTGPSELEWTFAAPVEFAQTGHPGHRLFDVATGSSVELSGEVDVVVAVPAGAVADVVRDVAAATGTAATIFVVGHAMGSLIQRAEAVAGGRTVYGLHPLFDTGARGLDGQIVYLANGSEPAGPRTAWLQDAVVSAGGILKVGSAQAHDESMRYVQALSHQTLIAFADAVTGSGRDVDADLWALRTPLFETLFGLAVRVLDTRQQTVIAGIQEELGGGVAAEMRDAFGWFENAASGAESAEHIARIRDQLSGSLYDTVRGSAEIAVTAAQRKRAELALQRRTGRLVGLRRTGRRGPLHVGRIVELTSMEVVLEELMVGKPGSAVLLEGDGAENVRRLGIAATPKRITFGLGHIDSIAGEVLDAELDDLLARIDRDVRFLVPESIAGAGVLEVVSRAPRVRAARLVDEVVRTGQRSVVIHLELRVDVDPERTIEALRELVESAYAWPIGVTRPFLRDVESISFLGPAGSFSEDAARQCAISLGVPADRFIERATFEDVLAAVAPTRLGVLPITSSASGLVSRAVNALLESSPDIAAGGVVDVPVRFDAYVRPGTSLAELAGCPVFSHPQAIAQCAAFIARWGLVAVPVSSTSESLQRLAGHDGRALALAGVDRGAELGLEVVEREVDDLSGSITRFLIVGHRESFGEPRGGSDPTVRSLWIVESPDALPGLLQGRSAGFDELLTDDDGRSLLVSSRMPGAEIPGARFLGRLPWSPRTPVVRVGE
jgi:prephenate dehydratase/prephenate dehydrogenase